jgi:hypothetical protein
MHHLLRRAIRRRLHRLKHLQLMRQLMRQRMTVTHTGLLVHRQQYQPPIRVLRPQHLQRMWVQHMVRLLHRQQNRQLTQPKLHRIAQQRRRPSRLRSTATPMHHR